MLFLFDTLLAADASAMYQTLLFSLFFAKRKTPSGAFPDGKIIYFSVTENHAFFSEQFHDD